METELISDQLSVSSEETETTCGHLFAEFRYTHILETFVGWFSQPHGCQQLLLLPFTEYPVLVIDGSPVMGLLLFHFVISGNFCLVRQ